MPDFMVEIENEAGADIRSIWTPNAANCFKRMKGHQLDALFTSLLDLKPDHPSYKGFTKCKKGEKDAILDALFAMRPPRKCTVLQQGKKRGLMLGCRTAFKPKAGGGMNPTPAPYPLW